jgi:hypothetical protein
VDDPGLLFLVGFFHRAAPGVMARDLMQAFDMTSAGIGSLARPTSTPMPR